QIAKVNPVLGLYRLVRVAGEAIENLPFWRQALVELDRRTLEPKNPLKDFGSGVGNHFILNLVDAIIQLFDHSQRLVDGQLEKANQQMVRAVAQPVPRVALDVGAILLQDL